MTAPILRRYSFKVDDRGWDSAHVVIGSDGYFSSVSAFGNYSHGWWHHGRGDFREFLIGLADDPGYVYRKLHSGNDRYDEDATLKAVKQYIVECRRDGSFTREQARAEWDLLEEHERLENEIAFHDWQRATDIGDAWEFWHTAPEPNCWAFCTRVMPKLAEVLRAELETEAASAGATR
jgi:hypothetical protein